MGGCSSKDGDGGVAKAAPPREGATHEGEVALAADTAALEDRAEAVAEGRFSERQIDWSYVEVYPETTALAAGVGGAAARGSVFPLKHRKSGQWLQLAVVSKSELLRVPGAVQGAWAARNMMEAARQSKFLLNLKYAFQSATKLYLVTRYMAGGTLRGLLDSLPGRRMPEEDARFYAAQAVLALENLCSLRAVHRDVTPSAFWLDGSGQMRLAGFSLARRVSRDEGYRTQGKAGTRGYAAPEVVDGDTYSFGADMWSFGVTLYEMLHGRLPFRHDQEEMVDGAVALELDDGLSPEVCALLRYALRVRQSKRLRVQQARHQPWFASVNWASVRSRRAKAPASVPPAPALPDAGSESLPRDTVHAEPILAAEQSQFVAWAHNARDIRRRTQRTGWGEGGGKAAEKDAKGKRADRVQELSGTAHGAE